jgi:glycosyltransferase involved in cell wall biosynthesis
MTAAATLMVVVLARDEAERIGPTLHAARDAGFPVTVVDGGSTDGTVAAAHAAGCVVHSRAFDDFASQRNWALDVVEEDYVLFVDADEIIVPELADDVRAAVGAGVDAAWIPTLDYFAGRWMLHGGWYPQPHLRLVRRGTARFVGAVHEELRFTGATPHVTALVHPLLHRSHLSLGHYLRKLDRYTEVEATTRRGRPSVLLARGIGEGVAVLGDRLVRRSAWRDGVPGVIGALAYAFYRFAIHAKAATAGAREPDDPQTAMRRWRQARGSAPAQDAQADVL